jgi:histidyl-tRNA synthetase
MGLREGHPEKEGVLVNLSDLVPEVLARINRKANLDSLVQQADGLRVVGGIKGELLDLEKAVGETPLSQEAIGAVPAS